LQKHTLGKTYTCRNTKEAKEAKKQDQQMVKASTKHIVLVVKKERQETYSVIFIWDKSPNLNPKPIYKPNFKFYFTLY
jgi:hypothetical protein